MFGSTFVPGGGGGSAAEVISFNPTWWSGITLGNGTQTAIYTINGKRCSGNIHILFGTTTTMGFDPVFAAPVAMHTSLKTYMTVGAVGLVDAGIALYMGEAIVHYQPYNLISARVINAAGTYAVWEYVSTYVPFTWGAGDILTIEFDYMIG